MSIHFKVCYVKKTSKEKSEFVVEKFQKDDIGFKELIRELNFDGYTYESVYAKNRYDGSWYSYNDFTVFMETKGEDFPTIESLDEFEKLMSD